MPAFILLRLPQGRKLELSAPEVPQPVAVRYGYGNFFRVNLYNKAGLPAVPFRTDHFAPDTYARWFADSEMRRFPKAYQLDHGRRLFFGYAQGVGCCAMLRMWRQTGERHYFDYVEAWVDSLINEKGEIHLYDMSTYNLDFTIREKYFSMFTARRETINIKRQWTSCKTIEKTSAHTGGRILAQIDLPAPDVAGWFVYGFSFHGTVWCGVQSSGVDR